MQARKRTCSDQSLWTIVHRHVVRRRFAMLTTCLIVVLFFRKAPSLDETTVTQTTRERLRLKHILYFTPYWGKNDFQFGLGRQPFVDYQCPETRCFAHAPNLPTHRVTNKSQFDAVLISARKNDFELVKHVEDIEGWRQPHQRFVFVMMESQAYSIDQLDEMHSFFNWTMTFKWNSDIPRPYGWFQDLNQPSAYATGPPETWIPFQKQQFLSGLPTRDESFHAMAKRPGKVAWIVSHCDTDSRREDYVHKLKEYISVDIFGGHCGKGPSCDIPYSISSVDNCTRYVQEHYKFYLAFENQFCNEYVTEKFFRRMDHSVVIVLGQANYSQIAPPHSYINVMDYDSPEALADYLHHLDENDDEYLSYFWWKDHYRVYHPYNSGGLNNFGKSMCQLCAKLHDEKEPAKTYTNMHEWWRDEAQCGKQLPGLKMRMSSYGKFGGGGVKPIRFKQNIPHHG